MKDASAFYTGHTIIEWDREKAVRGMNEWPDSLPLGLNSGIYAIDKVTDISYIKETCWDFHKILNGVD